MKRNAVYRLYSRSISLINPAILLVWISFPLDEVADPGLGKKQLNARLSENI
jgi:hypothetical protein